MQLKHLTEYIEELIEHGLVQFNSIHMFIADIKVHIKYVVTVFKIKKCYINFLQYNIKHRYMYSLSKYKS